MTRRKHLDDIKTGIGPLSRDEHGGKTRSWPCGVRRKGGMSVVWALERNSGTSRVVAPASAGNGSTPRPETEGESTGGGALGRTRA